MAANRGWVTMMLLALVVCVGQGVRGEQPPEKDEVVPPVRERILTTAPARAVELPQEEQRATKLLASQPQPGKVVEFTTDEKLRITHFRLENGTRVHHRYMDDRKNLVLVSISLGGARLEETAANAGVTEVATLAFNRPATKRLSSTEIADIMTGSKIELRAEYIERDSLDVLVTGSPEDLELGLRLAHALLTEGRIEPTVFEKWVETSLQQHEQYSKSPQFAAMKALLELISGGDPRYTMPDPGRVRAQTLERSQAWLERLCSEAPLEVAVVGDVRRDELVPLIEKYVGSLPKRSPSAARLDGLRRLSRAEGPLERRVVVNTTVPQAMVFYGFVGGNARDASDSRALELAAQALDSRLIERVRDELGLVYSIGVRSEASAVYEDAGLFVAGAPCAADKAEELLGEIGLIFAAFAAEGPTAEELADAKKQVLDNLGKRMKRPTYWWGRLQYAELHKVDLSELTHLKESYQALTQEQVRDVFRRYYVPQRQYQVIAVPVAAQPADGETKQAVPVAP